MSRYDLASVCRFLSIYTGAINIALWALALAGVALWGPRLLVWVWLVTVLWVAFIGCPLGLLAWRAGRDSWEGR